MRYFLSTLESTVDDWCNAYDALQHNATATNEEEEMEGQQLAATSIPEAILAQEQNPQELAVTSISIEEPISTEQLAPADVQAEQLAPIDILAEQLAPTEPISIEIAVIATEDPKHGWSKQNATWNAERVRTYVGRDAYTCTIYPTRCPDRYGFVLQERRPGGSTWEFFTQDQVRTCMNPRR